MSSVSAQYIIRRSAVSLLVQFMRVSVAYTLIVFSRSLVGTTPWTFLYRVVRTLSDERLA